MLCILPGRYLYLASLNPLVLVLNPDNRSSVCFNIREMGIGFHKPSEVKGPKRSEVDRVDRVHRVDGAQGGVVLTEHASILPIVILNDCLHRCSKRLSVFCAFLCHPCISVPRGLSLQALPTSHSHSTLSVSPLDYGT